MNDILMLTLTGAAIFAITSGLYSMRKMLKKQKDECLQYCRVGIHPIGIESAAAKELGVAPQKCPECGKVVVAMNPPF